MARKIIDTGTEGNTATGDTLRTAMTKINTNFDELYTDLAGTTSSGGILINPTTNGDTRIIANGTGIVEIDRLSINNTTVSSLDTNADITFVANGTGNIVSSGPFVVNGSTTTGSLVTNTIVSNGSNADLNLSGSGTGEVVTDANFKLSSGTPFLKIQRTDNANVPGIDFIGAAGTSGSKILFDGTSGTANELIFQTFTVAGGLAEAFRVQGGGAKVTGTLDVDGGVSITDNTITTSASNANLELTASGSGKVKVVGILSVDDGSTSDNYIGFGNDNDLKIFHDISFDNSVIDNLTGHLVIRNNPSNTTKDVYIQSDNDVLITSIAAGETFAKFSDDAGVELYFDNVKKFETTSTGATVTGIFNIGDGSSSDNYIGLGAANDLKIFHNGSHSIIRETGTGSLYIQSDTNVFIGKDSSSETMIKGIADGAVELYHDNTKKFETTAGGVSVVGAVTSTGATDLTLNTNAGTDSGSIVLKDGTNGDIVLTTDGSGDILLQAGGRVGIGSVNQPDTLLHLKDTNSVITLQRTNDANTPGLSFQNSGGNVRATIKMDGTSGTSKELVFQTDDGSLAERFRVTLSGAKVTGNLEVTGAQVDFTALPTSDPGVAGRLFRSGNDVKISTG